MPRRNGDRSLAVAGPRAWNGLSSYRRQDVSFRQFKQLLKYFYSWLTAEKDFGIFASWPGPLTKIWRSERDWREIFWYFRVVNRTICTFTASFTNHCWHFTPTQWAVYLSFVACQIWSVYSFIFPKTGRVQNSKVSHLTLTTPTEGQFICRWLLRPIKLYISKLASIGTPWQRKMKRPLFVHA